MSLSPEAEKSRERVFAAAEAMLRYVHRKQDTDALMAQLRLHFVNPNCMFTVSPYMLERMGMHPHDALLFSKIPELLRCTRMESFVKHPQLGRLPLAAEYLLAKATGLKVERFFMLCLDARGRMKECCIIHEGTESGAIFNIRQIMREVLRLDPAAVVFAHNHPRRTLRPSQEDIDCTLLGMQALSSLDTPVLDHIILAGNQAVSMRDNGFIPAPLWLKQAPESKLVRNWLSEKDMLRANNHRQLIPDEPVGQERAKAPPKTKEKKEKAPPKRKGK